MSVSKNTEFECGACYRIFNERKIKTLKCEHYICIECLEITQRIICPECGEDIILIENNKQKPDSTNVKIILNGVKVLNHTTQKTDGSRVDRAYFKNGNLKSSIYSKNGKPQSDNDEPAEVHYHENGKIKCKYWMEEGKLHRSAGFPAVLRWREDGTLQLEEWWKDNKFSDVKYYEVKDRSEEQTIKHNPEDKQKDESKEKEEGLFYVAWVNIVTAKYGTGNIAYPHSKAKVWCGARDGISHFLVPKEQREEWLKQMEKSTTNKIDY
jgi:hypothetical protein